MFPVFLNAAEVACTVTFGSALRTPHFVGCAQRCKTVKFINLAKVCKEMHKSLAQYLRTGRFGRYCDTAQVLGSGPAGHYGQFAQRGNSIRERRVGAEQRGQSAAAEPWLYDTERGSRRGNAGCGNALIIGA